MEGNIAQVERNSANLNDRLATTTYDVAISLHAEFSQPLLHFNEKLQTNQDIMISQVNGKNNVSMAFCNDSTPKCRSMKPFNSTECQNVEHIQATEH